MRTSRVAAFRFLASASGKPNLKRPGAIVATQSFRGQFFYAIQNHSLQYKTNHEMNRHQETRDDVLKEVFHGSANASKNHRECSDEHSTHRRKDNATHDKGNQHPSMPKPDRKQNAHMKCDHGPA
jgi:hypothetical protein